MSRLIPLSELPSPEHIEVAANSDAPFVWSAELPGHLDLERIMLDAGHLRRLQKLSGSAITFVGTDNDAKAESYDVSVAGMNGDGTAVMGRAKKVSPEDPSTKHTMYEFSNRAVRASYGGFGEVHYLNKAAMVNTVVSMRNKRNVTHEAAWSETLDEHLQRSMRQTAREVLAGGSGREKFMRIYEYGYLSMLGGFALHNAMEHDAVGVGTQLALYGGNYLYSLWHDQRQNMSLEGESLQKQRRWSLFTDSQTDRYIAFQGLSQINSLIKVKK